MTEKEISENLRGCMDCRDGKPADRNGSKLYQEGYGRQYEWEQMLSTLNIKQERIH